MKYNGCTVLYVAGIQYEMKLVVPQLCLTLSDPRDCSPPGSSVHGIFQARVLEWVVISFYIQPSYCGINMLCLLS